MRKGGYPEPLCAWSAKPYHTPAGAVVQATGDKGWAIMWAIRGRGYEETQEQLVMLEEELKEEGMKGGKAGGRNRGGRKRGGGQQ